MMFIFRADGNSKIGMGHLMRCLTIAKAMPENESLLFVCADDASAKAAHDHGMKTIVLHTDYRNMEEEIVCFQKLWDNTEKKVFLLDSYYVTDRYIEELQNYGKVFLIDDMQKHAYPADYVINYNLYADNEIYDRLYEDKKQKPIYFLGGEYIPLRDQFVEKKVKDVSTVRRILITTGGGDIANIALQILKRIYRSELEFVVVVGKFNPHLDEYLIWSKEKENVKILYDVQDMAELMLNCDMAITAGGSTVYELGFMGIPFICFAYAENQETLVQYIDEKKISASAGNWHKDQKATSRNIKGLFSDLIENERMRKAYAQKMKCLIDGKGAKKIAQVLLEAK